MVSYNTPFILPSHLLRTSSYMNFFRIQCNFILYKCININTPISFCFWRGWGGGGVVCFRFFFSFIFSFIFIDLFIHLFIILYLNFLFIYLFFWCSGMFRNVPECSMFLVLSKGRSKQKKISLHSLHKKRRKILLEKNLIHVTNMAAMTSRAVNL